MRIAGILAAAWLLDMMLGDPQGFPHPIRFIGWMISRGESLLRRLLPGHAYAAGVVLTAAVTGISAGLTWGVLTGLARIHPWAALAGETALCAQILATRSLRDESHRVLRSLVKGDLPEARKYLAWIVGRDTGTMEREAISRAVVETVAENTTDGVIAPLFYMMIGGAPLGMFYKAVNTLDSMIGYKNEKYLYFGRFAARLDDVMNFIPARIASALMILASALLGLDPKGAIKVYCRDRKKHASPNSGHSEAVAAGALNIRLGGDASYFGRVISKPTIGDPLRPVVPEDIIRTGRLMMVTSFLGVVVLSLIRWKVVGL